MKSIVITGCSWGAGEWPALDGTFEHAGLAQYFADDGYHVANLSSSGSGNLRLIKPLCQFLEINTQLDIEHIFVVQTDIGRDADPSFWYPWVPMTSPTLEKITMPLNQNITLEDNIKNFYGEFYSQLNNKLKVRNKRAYLIGGLTDLVMDFENQFEYLDFLIPSWIKLLVPTAETTYAMHFDGFTKFADKAQSIAVIRTSCNRQQLYIQNKQWFFPDGSHPNRLGHQVLYDAIKTKLSL